MCKKLFEDGTSIRFTIRHRQLSFVWVTIQVSSFHIFYCLLGESLKEKKSEKNSQNRKIRNGKRSRGEFIDLFSVGSSYK